jgi:hypothetical protein
MAWLKEFFDACRQGNIGLVKSIIARSIDPHSKNDFPLVLAAVSGNVDLLRVLVGEYGFNVNAWDEAALHHAAASGVVASVRYLLLRQAKLSCCIALKPTRHRNY